MIMTVQNYIHSTPVTRLVLFTPVLAAAVLEDKNNMNRDIRQARVNRYAHDMLNGNWAQNGETIKFAKDGTLLDGQHRLWAVVMSGVSIYMLVVEGLDAEVMPTLDTGAARTFSDVARIAGYTNNTLLAAAARWLFWYQHSRPNYVSVDSYAATHSELKSIVLTNPDMVERCNEVACHKMARRLARPGILAFVYTMAHRTDAERARTFLTLLDTGAGLHKGHPILVLREKLLGNQVNPAKLQPMVMAAITAKAWKAFDEGRTIQVLRWVTDEPFPEFTPAKKGKGNGR